MHDYMYAEAQNKTALIQLVQVLITDFSRLTGAKRSVLHCFVNTQVELMY